VLTAFCVVLGTLVLQGMTLKPLLQLLRLEPDQSLEQEVSRARIAVMQAALDSLDGDTSTAAAAVREQYAAARAVAENADAPQAATDYDELRLRAIASQRRALYRLRAEAQSATRPITGWRRRSTGPSSTLRRPAGSSR
jgi:monovalent cation/hydrogen antiporter